MTTIKNVDELFAKLPLESLERIEAKAKAAQAHINLINLRKQQKTTQADIAKRLHVSQANVSQMEQRGDMPLSSLLQYLHAIGAKLDACAVLPDGSRVSLLVE